MSLIGRLICKLTKHRRGKPVVLEGKRYFECPRCGRLNPHKVKPEGKPALKVAAG